VNLQVVSVTSRKHGRQGAAARAPRVFVDQPLTGAAVCLDRAEAHYLGHVLRLQRGDEAVLFNGHGAERRAVLEELTRHSARLQLNEQLEPLPEPPLQVSLLQSLPKAEAMDWVIQKATELGVSRVYPVMTQFSMVHLDADRAAQRLAHWQRVAQRACEQCGRHRPPLIEMPQSLADGLARLPVPALRLWLEPGSLGGLPTPTPAPARVALACGPEGGFSAQDLALLGHAGFAPVCLGPRTLRTETAAIVACGLVQARWGDLGPDRSPPPVKL
jgi:16S rRNA (uracil1498-N3)-methyltransferase